MTHERKARLIRRSEREEEEEAEHGGGAGGGEGRRKGLSEACRGTGMQWNRTVVALASTSAAPTAQAPTCTPGRPPPRSDMALASLRAVCEQEGASTSTRRGWRRTPTRTWPAGPLRASSHPDKSRQSSPDHVQHQPLQHAPLPPLQLPSPPSAPAARFPFLAASLTRCHVHARQRHVVVAHPGSGPDGHHAPPRRRRGWTQVGREGREVVAGGQLLLLQAAAPAALGRAPEVTCRAAGCRWRGLAGVGD